MFHNWNFHIINFIKNEHKNIRISNLNELMMDMGGKKIDDIF